MIKLRKIIILALVGINLNLCTHSAKAIDIHINTLSGVDQVVLAETSSSSSSHATITAYEQAENGIWVSKNTTTNGRVGKNGIVSIEVRKQSSGTTPEGILRLLKAYGNAANPGSLFPYTKITGNMYWNLNSGSDTYNQLVYSNPGGDYEHLIDYKTYNYMFTTDYNIEQIENKGGAIFFHCNGSGATSGCISVPESIMKWYMTWLDPEKNPSLIVTTTSDKSKYFVPETSEITAIKQTEEGIFLQWAHVDGAAMYTVQRSDTSDGDYKTVVSISDSSSMTWTDVSGTKSSYYRILTTNIIDGKIGYSSTSNPRNAEMPFVDVFDSLYYYHPVIWAVDHGITSGTSDTTFSPSDACTRAQIVQFLWNVAGSPEPQITDCQFTDVKSESWYYKAVLWAVENNITSGTSDTTFSPNAPCTRAQIVQFLWNVAGNPNPNSMHCEFIDVNTESWYYKAVLWAAENNITAGTSATEFSPNDVCTRGQIVTFLYRIYN